MDISYISNCIARKTGNLALAMMTVAISASALPASAAIITTGLTLNYDAGSDTSNNGVWENTGSFTGNNYDWQLGSGVTLDTSPITGFSGITGAYEFPASGSNSPDNKATAPSYQGLPGNPTDNSASFEIWFRPESLTNNQVLWETGGGGNGSSFTIRDKKLRFTMKNGSQNMVIEKDISETSEFIQAVATYDRGDGDLTDTLRLYINGGLVGTNTSNNVNDWAGGNASGLGGRNGNNGNTGGTGAQGNLNFNTFEGDIAIFRFYESALSESQVKQNFNAITEIPETSSPLSLLALGSLGGGSIFLRKNKKLREATGNIGK